MSTRHPMDRFERTHVGEGLCAVPTTVERLWSRKKREAGPKISIPDHTDVHWDAPPRSQRVVEAGPNAPLLIRLVRYPYVMRPVPMSHQPLFVREGQEERRPFGEVARDNADAWAKPAKFSPARGRHRLSVPGRATADAWLMTGGSNE